MKVLCLKMAKEEEKLAQEMYVFGIAITACYSVVSAFQSSFIYIKPPCRRHSSLIMATIDEKRHQVSKDILQGLQTSTSSGNIITNFYDDSTGLYSEGVWHNCLAGIASLQQLRKTNNEQKYLNDSMRIADSLFKYSWDGTSFRRRAWSGKWDHSRLEEAAQSNYYKESTEHRCVQHGIALMFWSKLTQYYNSSLLNETTQQQGGSDSSEEQYYRNKANIILAVSVLLSSSSVNIQRTYKTVRLF